MDRHAIISRIKKLLALSSSPNRAEAESALRFAQELMQKYGVEASDVERGEIGIEPTEDLRSTVQEWDHKLLMVIAKAHGCELIRDNFAWRRTRMTLVGRSVNVEVSRLMYAYVRKSALAEARRISPKKRNNFLHGFVMGIAYQTHTLRITWSPEEQEKIQTFIAKRYDALIKAPFDKSRWSQAMAAGVNSGSNLSLNRQMNATETPGLLPHA